MIHQASVSLQSFLLGLGVLSFLLVDCLGTSLGSWDYLIDQPWAYCGTFYIIVNLVIALIFYGPEWQVAWRGCLLGVGCGGGILTWVLAPVSFKVFGCYVVVLTFFHYSEYFATALGNPSNLSLDSYLLNHSWAYGIAAVASWFEFFVECWLIPDMKQVWGITIIGFMLCMLGEVMRKGAMFTAKTNFNHIIQTNHAPDHELVTWGAYRWFRHPSYVGWFWWSVGTQVILINPVCLVAYTVASWSFFHERIYFEELTLIKFFGEKYLDYQKRVGTGLPFIKGYQYNNN